MQINKLSQSNRANSLNFGKLYNGYCISENILKTNNKALKKELNSISRLIRKEELHKAENVDIILQYTPKDGFYGVISSKTQGTPNHPNHKKSLTKDEVSIKNFIDWVKSWDSLYSNK